VELLLNEQQTLLADTAVRLCRDAGGPQRARAVRDGKLEADAQAWQQAISAGWPGILVSEAHGGSELGLFDAALAVEEAGKRLLMVPHAEAMAAAWIVSRATPNDAALALLADHIEGVKLIVPATEAAHWRFGQGASAPVILSERASSLSGTIPFVPFASSADFLLVANGAVVALVDAKAKGVTRAAHVNVDGSAAGTVTLDHVAVGEGFILARGDAAARLAADLQNALTLLTWDLPPRPTPSRWNTSRSASSSASRSAASRRCSIAPSTASSTSSSTARWSIACSRNSIAASIIRPW